MILWIYRGFTRLDADKYDLGYHSWDILPTDLVAKGEKQKNVSKISGKGDLGDFQSHAPLKLTVAYQVTLHWRHDLSNKHHVHENRHFAALCSAIWSSKTIQIYLLRNDGYRVLLLRNFLLYRSI